MVPARVTVVLFNHGYVPWDLISASDSLCPAVAAALFRSYVDVSARWMAAPDLQYVGAMDLRRQRRRLPGALAVPGAVFLVCGLAAALLHTLFNIGSTVPSVGASGAIAGVMGASSFVSTRAGLTLVPFFFVFFMWLPARIVLGYWFVAQFLSGAAT